MPQEIYITKKYHYTFSTDAPLIEGEKVANIGHIRAWVEEGGDPEYFDHSNDDDVKPNASEWVVSDCGGEVDIKVEDNGL